MKKALLFLVLMAVGVLTYGQDSRILVPNKHNQVAEADQAPIDGTYNFDWGKPSNLVVKSLSTVDEFLIGGTRHDNQSNYSLQNRAYLFPDGKFGGTWMYGIVETAFPERGTGYNFFNGTSWGPEPTARIELDVRTGWPSYAPYGANGEIVVAHTVSSGTLHISYRTTKGTGAWIQQSFITPPVGAFGLWYPRMVTSGPNRNIIHIAALTTSVASGGTLYQGVDGAVLYFRSQDGGTTWDIPGVVLPGMGAEFYPFLGLDQFTWIEPRGNHLALLVGGRTTDLFLMESLNGGDTWVKKMIWKNPYNCATFAPAFYCADGSVHGAIDKHGRIHVAIGVNRRSITSATSSSWYPTVGGLVYWNTDMPGWLNTFDNTWHLDSLNATGHLKVGYVDLNGDGQWNVLSGNACVGYYYIGTTSMPQVVVDDNDVIFIVFSHMTEGYNDTQKNYRKLFGMTSPDGGTTWGNPIHLTADEWHDYDECVFPSVAANTDNAYHLIYQADEKPGLAMRGGGSSLPHAYVDNYIYYMRVLKADMVGVSNPKPEITITKISQNYPNPVQGNTSFELVLDQRASVAVSVFNLMGQKVMELDQGMFVAGYHTIHLDMTGQTPGLYFYTVKAGEQTMTRKMMVE
ncbi:MAG: T9SS type A sorting domain-containing protein [Bacteroidales bacterium]|nr:T9SS type A sorting domain-containing protein [Bacteroidales bacterium]